MVFGIFVGGVGEAGEWRIEKEFDPHCTRCAGLWWEQGGKDFTSKGL